MKPGCYLDQFVHSEGSSVCQRCAYYYPCTALLGGLIPIKRKAFIERLLRTDLSFTERVDAIVAAYGCTQNAANLALSRAMKKA